MFHHDAHYMVAAADSRSWNFRCFTANQLDRLSEWSDQFRHGVENVGLTPVFSEITLSGGLKLT